MPGADYTGARLVTHYLLRIVFSKVGLPGSLGQRPGRRDPQRNGALPRVIECMAAFTGAARAGTARSRPVAHGAHIDDQDPRSRCWPWRQSSVNVARYRLTSGDDPAWTLRNLDPQPRSNTRIGVRHGSKTSRSLESDRRLRATDKRPRTQRHRRAANPAFSS